MTFFPPVFVGAIVIVALAVFIGLPHAAAASLPDDSYYQLDVSLETHAGEKIAFDAFRGRPVIVSMFYGTCPHVCPVLISTIKEVGEQLPVAIRDELRVLMISIDPERDTPAHLLELVERHNVDSTRWRLARTQPSQTRPLAAVLGIKYKALPDGEFNHTSAIILLDPQGREITRSTKLGAPSAEFVEVVQAALRAAVTEGNQH